MLSHVTRLDVKALVGRGVGERHLSGGYGGGSEMELETGVGPGEGKGAVLGRMFAKCGVEVGGVHLKCSADGNSKFANSPLYERNNVRTWSCGGEQASHQGLLPF